MTRSDPHNPHRPTDVETISQDWQYTAFSTGIETSPGFDRMIVIFRINAPISESSWQAMDQATDRAASS